MKRLFMAIIIFLFFFGMSMFGFYVELDSFAAIGNKEFVNSCQIGVMGLIIAYLIAEVLP